MDSCDAIADYLVSHFDTHSNKEEIGDHA